MNRSLFCYALAAGLFLHTAVQAHDGDKEPEPAFANTSLQLIANRGQVTDQHGELRPDIDAKAEYNGVTMFVGDGQLHYQWTKTSPRPSPKEREINPNDEIPNSKSGRTVTSTSERPGEVSIYRMDVTLVGANKNVQPVFEQPTGYFENYYLAHTGENGVQAKGYNRVVYRNVYPNIDWVVYISPLPASPQRGGDMKNDNVSSLSLEGGRGEAALKYDFIVHPGGNVADIRMRYEGATELKIADGALVAVTPYGSITEDAPYSYMQDGGAAVASKYILDGNELRFDVGRYAGTLIIDPKIGWATYYGGNGGDFGADVVTDTAGNVYMCGYTGSNNNIATSGTHQQAHAGVASSDGFVVKFNPNGSRAWGTYYGGMGTDAAYNIVADTLGGIYITGITTSTAGIASNSAYQDTITFIPGGGSSNMMLVKLNSTNGTRAWGTYYAANNVLGLSCDMDGNTYFSAASDVPVNGLATTGVFLTTPTAYILASFNSSGQRIWATYNYSGGSTHYDDYNKAVYICGLTGAATGLPSTGAYQGTYGGGNMDGFISRFTTNGARVWSTYYGGTDRDWFDNMTTDKTGNLYLVGYSSSTNAIASTGTHQATYSTAFRNGMVVKFNANGQRIWGSYYCANTTVNDVCLDAKSNVYIGGGTTDNTGTVASSNGYQTSLSGLQDAFLAIIHPNTGQRIWGTYYGGPATGIGDEVRGLSYAKGKVYMAGSATSLTGIANNAGFQQTNGGGVGYSDAMLVEWYADTAVNIREPFNDTLKCAGDALAVPYVVNQNFRSGNVFTVQLSDVTGSFATPVNIGTATTNLAGVINCTIPGSTAAGSGYKIRVTGSAPADTSMLLFGNLRINPKPANATAGINKTNICTGDTLRMTSSSSTSGVTYSWTGPDGFSVNTANTTLPNPPLAGTGDYINTISNNGCTVKDTFTVTVAQSPENVTATNNGAVCTGDTLRLQSSSTTGGVTYNWSPGNYSTQNVAIPNVAKTQGGVYTVTATLGNCTTTATTTAQVEQAPVINIVPTAGTALCIGELAQFSAFLNDAGTNPQLQWQVNGVDKAGETTNTFKTATLNHGDKVRLKVIPNTSCPGTRYSNEITMGIYAPKAPTVSIVADINPPWDDNTIVTFTATAANATSVNGVPPTYQWKKNGQDIGGAVSNYWAVNTNALNDNDKICVLVTSAYECPVPDTVLSNCINSSFTGVNDVTTSSIKVYPNPVEAVLHIDGLATGHSVALYDVVGRKCNVVYQDGSIDMSALPSGNYVLQVVDANGERGYFKVTKE